MQIENTAELSTCDLLKVKCHGLHIKLLEEVCEKKFSWVVIHRTHANEGRSRLVAAVLMPIKAALD